MTREEAIKVLENATIEPTWGGSFRATSEALNMAIEALKREQPDEWCTDCKEYDKEKKCCPRFNKVIREAMKRVPHEDGTLEVKVEDATKVGRVLIADDKHRGGLYYPDEDEPKGDDLISRADAIEAVTGALDAIDHVPKWVFDKLTCAINILPSADRPRGYWKHNTTYKSLVFCSECDMPYEAGMTPRNFCPNCGADMRGDQDE